MKEESLLLLSDLQKLINQVVLIDYTIIILEGDAYLKENEIHAVAAVTIRPEDYEKAKEVMLYIIEKLGGYFCGDTADFTPVVAAKKN